MKRLDPIHPGEILKCEFMDPYALTVGALAKALFIPTETIDTIIQCQGGITADLAMRLARFFDTDAKSWLNLQSAYELELIDRNNKPEIQSIEPLCSGKVPSSDL